MKETIYLFKRKGLVGAFAHAWFLFWHLFELVVLILKGRGGRYLTMQSKQQLNTIIFTLSVHIPKFIQSNSALHYALKQISYSSIYRIKKSANHLTAISFSRYNKISDWMKVSRCDDITLLVNNPRTDKSI